MGVAALVLGIISVVVAFIPFCGTWAIIPAAIGLILGIIDWVKNQKEGQPKGKAIAGTICSVIAIVIIMAWWAIAAKTINKAADELNKTDWNQVFSGLDEALTDWELESED